MNFAEVLRWLIALTLLALAGSWFLPMARRFFPHESLKLHLALSWGVSIGIFTNLLAWLGWWRIHPLLTLGLLAICWGGSWAMARRLPAAPRLQGAKLSPLALFGVAVLGALSLYALAHLSYYPFIGDDTLSRYALVSRQLLARGSLAGYWLDGYPLRQSIAYLIPLQFAPKAEQIAKLVSFGDVLALLAVSASLSERWFGRLSSWWTIGLLATCPLFLYWSAFEYVDLPTGLYFVLSAWAVDVWQRQPNNRHALLLGCLLGLALWSKQAGFAAGLSAALLVTIRLGREWQNAQRWRELAGMGLGVLAGGGWWYLLNGLAYGWQNAVPSPGAYYAGLASHAWQQLWIFWSEARAFGFATSLAISLGCALALGWAFSQARRGNWQALKPLASAGLWALPYSALWWWGFSYDARFLLTVLPFYCLASSAGWTVASNWAKRALSGKVRAGAVIALWLAFATLGVQQSRLGGAYYWLTQPLATYATRITRAKGPLYPTAQFINEHLPAQAKIYSMDGRLAYFLPSQQLRVGYPSLAELAGFDYFVVGSWAGSLYPALGNAAMLDSLQDANLFREVYVAPGGGLRVLKVTQK